MSAGSAFASGVRAGQNIWNSAIQNAMAGKRMDMLRTQFRFEQTQRQKKLDDELVSQAAKDKFVTATASEKFDFSTPEGMKLYSSLKSSVEPIILRDAATWKQYENFSKAFELREGYPVFLEEQREILINGRTWDKNNFGNPRPQIKDLKTGELVDDNKLMAKLNREHAEKIAEETTLRADDFKVIQEWNQKFHGKQFPVLAIEGLPGEPMPDAPIKDFATATRLLLDYDERLVRDKAIAAAETKDDIEYRGGFNTWRRLLKNPALDAKNPEDQKSYRTWAHDEEISGLMAEAGLEAFKLADELKPDLVSGGYENMAEVTGMINDLIRKQEEEAGVKKAMAQKPLTESQAKDYIFSGRLKLMEQTIAKLEASGFKPESIANDIGMKWLPELGKTDDQKRYIAARANWIAAVLRRESGAAIAESEYKGGFEQYFPLVNDSPTVIADKRNARRQVEQDMRATATNQPILSDYQTVGDPVIYNSEAEVEAAMSRGRLKIGDTYRYKNERGLIQNGVVQPPVDVVQPPSDAGVQLPDPHLPPTWQPLP